MPDKSERPIAYGSRTLSKAEQHYSQIEKEALSLIFGVKKFHQFLYGRPFTMVTDHKPLTTIFRSKKGIPTVTAARLQRWAILLVAYQYQIEFRSTNQHSNADGLSRLLLKESHADENSSAQASKVNLMQLNSIPMTSADLRQTTRKDRLLSKVYRYTLHGWPAKVDKELQPYFAGRLEITVEDECLLWGIRVIIPQKFQVQLLKELHISRQGTVRMKALSRRHIWWPGIDKAIEEAAKRCSACQRSSKDPEMVTLHP